MTTAPARIASSWVTRAGSNCRRGERVGLVPDPLHDAPPARVHEYPWPTRGNVLHQRLSRQQISVPTRRQCAVLHRLSLIRQVQEHGESTGVPPPDRDEALALRAALGSAASQLAPLCPEARQCPRQFEHRRTVLAGGLPRHRLAAVRIVPTGQTQLVTVVDAWSSRQREQQDQRLLGRLNVSTYRGHEARRVVRAEEVELARHRLRRVGAQQTSHDVGETARAETWDAVEPRARQLVVVEMTPDQPED